MKRYRVRQTAPRRFKREIKQSVCTSASTNWARLVYIYIAVPVVVGPSCSWPRSQLQLAPVAVGQLQQHPICALQRTGLMGAAQSFSFKIMHSASPNKEKPHSQKGNCTIWGLKGTHGPGIAALRRKPPARSVLGQSRVLI